MNIFEIKSLSGGYRGNKIIQDISFQVNEGDFLGIIGPNGAGKTTLLKLMTGILKHNNGNIFYKGRDISLISRLDFARKIAVIPQFNETLFHFSVEEFILMGRFPHRKKWHSLTIQDYQILDKALELTDTNMLRKRPMNELSGGERQRVIIAQGIAQEPEIFLLDEPTAHMDIGHQTELLDLLKKLNLEKSLTVITILHDLNLAGEYCNKLLLLDNGIVYSFGNPENVLTYKNIEKVYKTVVVVNKNPVSLKPFIIPVSAKHLKQ